MTAVARKSDAERQINVLTDEKLAELSKLKSYISAEERDDYIKNKKLVLLCISEGTAAMHANDMDTSWQWMSLVALPPHTLRSLKSIMGAQFIRDNKLITWRADQLYGANWLDKED